jgi:hypothetical protein
MTDADFDDIHHALGRPRSSSEVEAAFRNSYCTETDGDQAKHFEALGFWTPTRSINGGRDTVYAVNDAGKKALARWLAAGQSVDRMKELTA